MSVNELLLLLLLFVIIIRINNINLCIIHLRMTLYIVQQVKLAYIPDNLYHPRAEEVNKSISGVTGKLLIKSKQEVSCDLWQAKSFLNISFLER